jgi:ArsR family transcriptional regulator
MQDLAQVFKALADESRLRILNIILASGELCVCDIEAIMGFSQTKVSRHLAYLKRAGLVDDRRQGLWMLYSMAKPKSEEHSQLLDCVKAILEANAVTKRDVTRLSKNIKKGCCVTFTAVRPNSIPVTLKLTST